MAAVLLSLVVPLLSLALITGPILLKSFGPVVIPSGLLPVVCAIFWILTLIVVGTVCKEADGRPESRAFNAFALALVVAMLAVVPAAVFAWLALTDWSYEHRGGVTSCSVVAVDEHIEHHQSAMTGERVASNSPIPTQWIAMSRA
ncbi:hypothetical protein ABZ897_12660 [Nonomuraea sp. NPDC046802]|uniref:hypothetical protein n=1 Tax=Nonomuraea sp. NPDC046802 TaxID=3154919 RepID=UPI0033E81A53